MIERDWDDERLRRHVEALPVWRGKPAIDDLIGGLCNRSFVVTDSNRKLVVRIGFDIPVHGIMQHSVSASLMAASDIGVTPKLVYAEPFLNVIEFIDGRALRPEDLRDPERAAELVETLKTLHHGSHALRGTATYFWPFQVVRTYAHLGLDRNSRLSSELPEVMRIATVLEAQVAPFTPVLTHNDVVPQNVMLDRSNRIWLIDWDYGGYGHPLFDIAGITANADVPEAVEAEVMRAHFGPVTDQERRQFMIFKLIINLREYMWGMVQEIESRLTGDVVKAAMMQLYPDQKEGYEGYTDLNRQRFETLWRDHRREFE